MKTDTETELFEQDGREIPHYDVIVFQKCRFQACVSQTPKKISETKNYFTCTKFITENSSFDNFERENINS